MEGWTDPHVRARSTLAAGGAGISSSDPLSDHMLVQLVTGLLLSAVVVVVVHQCL